MSGYADTQGIDERREFFRVDDSVVLEYRELSTVDASAYLDQMENDIPNRFTAAASFAATSRQMGHLLHSVRDISSDLARYLESLDGKLNMLARMFLVEELEVPEKHTCDVSISANGIAFSTDTPQKVDDLLEIKIVLFPSYLGLLSIGSVVSCDATDKTDHPYRIAVRFAHLSDEEQEMLVKHVLYKQTEERRKKLEEG